MARRPDFTWAMLVAGLIFLGVSLSHRDGAGRIPVRPHPLRSTARPSPSSSRPSRCIWPRIRSRQAIPPGRRVLPPHASSALQRFRWLTGGFLGSTLCYYAYGYPLSQV